MLELFKTVLILSVFGFALTAVLLILKPVTSKKFPAVWQYYVWVAVLLFMIVPVYKIIPQKQAQKLSPIPTMRQTDFYEFTETPEAAASEQIPDLPKEINTLPRFNPLDFAAYIWLGGTCIYLLVVLSSYVCYTAHKRKSSVTITENTLLEEVKKELNIKKHIRIRMSEDIHSPLLAGVFLPVIYLPCREISDENMRMVFLHELTHYKRRDLALKWFAVFVNAVHWFNPLAYLVCSNLSEACEVSCDMSVTKNMTDSQQKLYMKTILDLAG